MTRRVTHAFDVIYVGFLLGHGGDALQMLSLADEMQRRGARVKIIVPAGEHSATFKTRCEGLGILCERTDLLATGMYESRQSVRSLVRLFRSLDAAVVHFHTGNSCLPRTAMAALALLRSPPAFVTTHSPYETIDANGLSGRYWGQMARRRFLAVVCPSDHARRFQVRCGIPDGVAVTVRNAVDATGVTSGDAAKARAALGLEADAPVVLFCSRIDAQKRPVEAVGIFARAAAAHPLAVLVFLGSGSQEEGVRREAVRLGLGDRVLMAGYQTNVPDWLALATVWLLPTERENFSVAVLEALAAGCPILSTSCPGNDEILVNGENALTFAVGDVAGGGDHLDRLLGDATLRGRLAEGAQATARTHTVERMVEEYCRVYGRAPSAPAALRPQVPVPG